MCLDFVYVPYFLPLSDRQPARWRDAAGPPVPRQWLVSSSFSSDATLYGR